MHCQWVNFSQHAKQGQILNNSDSSSQTIISSEGWWVVKEGLHYAGSLDEHVLSYTWLGKRLVEELSWPIKLLVDVIHWGSSIIVSLDLLQKRVFSNSNGALDISLYCLIHVMNQLLGCLCILDRPMFQSYLKKQVVLICTELAYLHLTSDSFSLLLCWFLRSSWVHPSAHSTSCAN